MDEQNESERDLGIFAQEVLGRIITDPDFRRRFIDKSAELIGEVNRLEEGDVTGYLMPRNLIVDPMKAALGAELELLRPLKLWLDVCQSLGLHISLTNIGGSVPAKDSPPHPVSDRPRAY